MGKFKAKYIVIPLLTAAIIGGTALATISKAESNSTVMVAKVSDLNNSMGLSILDYYSGSDFIGTLKKGSIQNVKLNEELKIEEVLVKKGDTVKKGDKLFTYDLVTLKIALAEAENQLKNCENNITAANNELKILKKLQPSENAPQTVTITTQPDENDEPDLPEKKETPDTPSPSDKFMYEKKITSKSIPTGGTGTEEDPYTYYVGEDTTVTKEALLLMCPEDGKSLFALFVVCDEQGSPIYARNVNGTKIDRQNVKDWNVNDGVNKDKSGNITFDGGSANFASFTVAQLPTTNNPDMPQMEGMEGMFGLEDIAGLEGYEGMNEAPQIQQPSNLPSANNNTAPSDEITEKDNYIYSKEELKNMISSKEKEIEKLELEKRQNNIDLSIAKKKLEVGAEVAELDGKITFLAKDIKHLSENGAYLTITSSTGMNISSTIGEFSLANIKEGTKMKIQDYDNGKTYTGEVTYISDTPSIEDELSGSNNMESKYEFIVNVENNINLTEDGSVSMSIIKEDEQNVMCIDVLFVRAEGAKHYVMAANKDNIIEKRYVKVGRTMYSSVEIISGLSEDDRIANAYGKTKEGMKAVDGDADTILYGTMGSMFI